MSCRNKNAFQATNTTRRVVEEITAVVDDIDVTITEENTVVTNDSTNARRSLTPGEIERRLDECSLTAAQRERIYEYCGCLCYRLLQYVPLPATHPSLNRSLLILACGGTLPCDHPSFEDLLCEGLENRRDRNFNPFNRCQCECSLTPAQRERIYRYLGRASYHLLRDADIENLNRILLRLACENNACARELFYDLLDDALDC